MMLALHEMILHHAMQASCSLPDNDITSVHIPQVHTANSNTLT